MARRFGFCLQSLLVFSSLLAIVFSDDCVQLQSSEYENKYFQKLMCTLNPTCGTFDAATFTPETIELYEGDNLLVTASKRSMYTLTRLGQVVAQDVFRNTKWNSELSFGIAVPQEGDNLVTYRCTVKGKSQSGEVLTLTTTYSSVKGPIGEPVNPPNEPQPATERDSKATEPPRIGSEETRPCLTFTAGLITPVSSPRNPTDHFVFSCRVSKCNDEDQWTLTSIRAIKMNAAAEVALGSIERPQGVAVALARKPSEQNFRVTGLLRDDGSSFLNAEWDRPDGNDYGVYRCIVTFSNNQAMSRTVSENTEFQSTRNFVDSLLGTIGG
ncbi:transient receptor potential cation channel subfamily M member 1 [Biomphalaria pfeifferi]|uniref:Transient receptor potential cation channel subfamily M member 1 n=1 Tax=Biomphalaria pfeifferi TaxID=112525 RepID=A0AAD8BSG8_BIOPF|nr:transient receptor potential cation channel subfamily M member 1 [Biomphalaria pfeifferi]